MIHSKESFLNRLRKCQRGQMAVWVPLLIPVIFGMGGLVVDVGHAYVCYRELQASTDAAAMAGAEGLPGGAAAGESEATLYSSVSGNNNAYSSLNKPSAITGAAISFYPYCVKNVTGVMPCSSGGIVNNALRVTQTVTVPTYFIRVLAVLGINSAKSITLTAQATAVVTGGTREPDSVAILFDTSSSMTNSDSSGNCTGSKEKCSLLGAQILLSEFSPCGWGLGSCGTATNGQVASPFDEVSIFTFPAQTASTQATNDYACPSKAPSEIAYPDSTANTSSPLTAALTSTQLTALTKVYQVVPLSSDYRTSDTTVTPSPLNLSSNLVKTTGGNSYWSGTTGGCTGMQAKGGEGTFFAGVIYTAQQYLMANMRTGTNNIIILLSDGDASSATLSGGTLNSGAKAGTYPSSTGLCSQAIQAATAAKAGGTEIFVVGYGVGSGGCTGTGDSGKTACSTLKAIASPDTKRPHFYEDKSSVTCAGATSVTMSGQTNTISGIFSQIVASLSKPKLVSTGAN
jgi:Flp pilus assembly protein TadG